MKIKMIVTDLDGTLLHSNKELSERTIQALRECQRQGIIVAIATARYWMGAESYIELLHPDYAITTDGTLIHRTDELIYSCGFDADTTNQIIKMILEVNKDADITTAAGKRIYWNSLHISESKRLSKATYHDYKQPLPEAAHKIVTTLPSTEAAKNIASTAHCKFIAYRRENLYGFINANAGKLPAIRHLADKLHIPFNEIAAFGDDGNDIDMLKACGVSVAVSNAVPEVLEIADKVTLSNNEDGVASFIEEEILVSNKISAQSVMSHQ